MFQPLAALIITITVICATAEAEHQQVVLTYQNTSNINRFTYFLEILDAALFATIRNFGNYEYKIYPQAIAGYDLTSKMKIIPPPINFGWGSIQDVNEKGLIAIRTPLYKGVIGMRVFVTTPRIQKQINGSFGLNELKKFKIGAGENWDDVSIMTDAGLEVVTAKSLDELYQMLADRRIDLVSRSVFEAYLELNDLNKKHKDFIVESKIALFYKNDMLFYLPSSESRLADRIRKGMSAILKNGVFDKIFLRNYGKEIAIGMKGRKVISIQNKKFESSRMFIDKSYWYF